MIKKIYLTIFISLTAITASMAQSLDIHFNGLGFLDNREYKDFTARSRTYSGTRVALDLGLNLDSVNHFIVGVDGIHEFGAKPYFLKANPVAYYKYESKNWLFDAGEFPRIGLLDNYPRALLNDTLRYYRPNIEGLLARYQNPHFTETGWIDWVSRQTATDREQFLFGFEGKWRPSLTGPFYISHYVLMLHDAGAEILLPNDHIGDDGGGQIKLGLDFSHKQTTFDSLSVEAGFMGSFQRRRGVDGGKFQKGFVASAYVSYHRFAAFNEFYAGQGSELSFGDAFYEKKFYDRLDLMFTPFLFNRIKGQFIFSIHRTPGFTSNQEAFRVTYDLGRKTLVRWKYN
ncbi:hypothetical protein [Mucilaginibacter sp. L3T2-6]|uniref:hypothetical protein n=1 Tax=Mucilaginibacter sp. L3T2-6 TaxID=3062491 RepID=UPI0026747E17|nr:hypothetical protein [Mucilaginibacter sp. L3T2-6]MDO3644461.1 hypothetical protein [Mucilaginibacter sp. L3T2-6]MDV6216913.1 hypothetical protein [Mucilaginibacter sp. L3T2-6]